MQKIINFFYFRNQQKHKHIGSRVASFSVLEQNWLSFLFNLPCFYFPYLHKGSIGIEKKSTSEIFSEFHVSDYIDSEK